MAKGIRNSLGKSKRVREPAQTVRMFQSSHEAENFQIRLSPNKHPERFITIIGKEMVDFIRGNAALQIKGNVQFLKYQKEYTNSKGYFVPAQWRLSKGWLGTTSAARFIYEHFNNINLNEWERVRKENRDQNDFRLENLKLQGELNV